MGHERCVATYLTTLANHRIRIYPGTPFDMCARTDDRSRAHGSSGVDDSALVHLGGDINAWGQLGHAGTVAVLE